MFPKLKQLTFRRVIVGMMLNKSAEVNFEEPDLAIEAEELAIFQLVIFCFQFCYYSIDN